MQADDTLNAELQARLSQNSASITVVSALHVGFVASILKHSRGLWQATFQAEYIDELYRCLEQSPFILDISSPDQAYRTEDTGRDQLGIYAHTGHCLCRLDWRTVGQCGNNDYPIPDEVDISYGANGLSAGQSRLSFCGCRLAAVGGTRCRNYQLHRWIYPWKLHAIRRFRRHRRYLQHSRVLWIS